MSPTHAEPAAPVPVTRVPAQVQRCGGVTCPPGTCDHDDEVQRHADGPGPTAVPPTVLGVLGTPGTPLDPAVRTSAEGRFGHDFGNVRIHTDADAARSAADIHASAYTFGSHVVMGAGRHQPHTAAGQRLLTHELAHVVQQGSPSGPPTSISDPHDPAERAAQRAADLDAASPPPGMVGAPVEGSIRDSMQRRSGAGQVLAGAIAGVAAPLALVHREMSDEAGPDDGPFGGGAFGGGGAGGSWDEARETASFPSSSSGGAAVGAAPPSSGPVQVCARNLALTSLANHAYVEAPPKSYAVISPLCPQHWYDTPLTATSAQKWDNSPDPCGKTPSCVPCDPAPGVTDVRACLHDAFTAYANPSKYNAPFGPNSNTFAGTLARRCCASMVPKPAALGRVPGWDEPPAPVRGGSKPCPPGPTC